MGMFSLAAFYGAQFSRTRIVFYDESDESSKISIPMAYEDGFWEKPHVEILKKLKKGKSWIRN